MVAYRLFTNQTFYIWTHNAGLTKWPFQVNRKTLFVSYATDAEILSCLALGLKEPSRNLDLLPEFRRIMNGRPKVSSFGLLSALRTFGLRAMESEQKDYWRSVAIRGGPFTQEEHDGLLAYCAEDVFPLVNLLWRMKEHIRLDQAVVRGEYVRTTAHMIFRGVPIDAQKYRLLISHKEELLRRLIDEFDQPYGVFVNGHFSFSKLDDYVKRNGLVWPRTRSGRLSKAGDVVHELADMYPELQQLHQLLKTVSLLRQQGLSVGPDSRNRASFFSFGTKTSRNAPKASQFIFGAPAWVRSFIQAPPGYAVIYIDWTAQEFGIAAALSQDKAMREAYQTGDVHMAFAIQAGAAPAGATKKTHPEVRALFKTVVLATQYAMGAESLATRIKKPVPIARDLLNLHRRTYVTFWEWSDAVVRTARLNGVLRTRFGWEWNIGADGDRINDRSLRNYPVQSAGAEMMRVASILAAQEGMPVLCPVHDAFLLECKIEDVDATVQRMQDIMERASEIVLDGFQLRSTPHVYAYPDRFVDERGVDMWDRVHRFLLEKEETRAAA
jgi:hypothetical protein